MKGNKILVFTAAWMNQEAVALRLEYDPIHGKFWEIYLNA